MASRLNTSRGPPHVLADFGDFFSASRAILTAHLERTNPKPSGHMQWPRHKLDNTAGACFKSYLSSIRT